MANSDLIKGEGAVRRSQGFVNYGKQFTGTGDGGTQFVRASVAANEAKLAEVQETVNNAMGMMKNNLDLTGFKPEEQKAMRKFLISERNKYAYSASAISKLSDSTDPDYQYHVDIMNGVNNSFTNLSAQVKSYKANKLEFADGYNQGMYSNGNDGDLELENMSIMGFGDNVAPLYVGEGGNLGFNTSKGKVSFNDYQQPFMKDYELASNLATTANSLYTSHTQLSPTQENVIRLDLQKSLSRPNALKSIVSKDFSDDGFVFDGIDINSPDAKEQVINRIIEGYRGTARAGYNEYQARTNKGGKKSNSDSNKAPNQGPYSSGKDARNAEKLDALFSVPGVSKVIGGNTVVYNPNIELTAKEDPTGQRGAFEVKGEILTYDEMLEFLNA